MTCQWHQRGAEFVCLQCGIVRQQPAMRICPSDKLATREKPKLGDRTEAMLKKMGITEARWIEAKSLFGLLPAGGCNCGARKAYLNKLSEWKRGLE